MPGSVGLTHAAREERLGAVTGADGAVRSSVEADHQRRLVTIFGNVWLAYRRKGTTNLYPADAALELAGGVVLPTVCGRSPPP